MKINFRNINFKKIAAIALCGAVLVTSSVDLINTVYDYKTANTEYEELSDLCTYDLDDYYYEEIEDNHDEKEDNLLDKIIKIFIPSALSEEKRVNPYVLNEEVTSSVVDVNKIRLKVINWEKLKEINQDVVGWIVQKDTVIDYPIVQGEDNIFYLTNSYKKKKSSAGTIFLNSFNNENFNDDVSYIYGHHMKNGEMFYSINKYQKQYYYNNNKYMILYTEDNVYLVEIFAGNLVNGSDYVPIGNFNSKDEFDEFVQQTRINSKIETDIEVTYGDKIIGLCTCTYDGDNMRFIVYGKLVPLCKEIKKDNIGVEKVKKIENRI